ncbi:DNA cytosine methyltransferase [Pedobacter deserti]|uniref:DNA cytosine methyltransferase n=1 Tax=Pedobacter deserti TaxID=2817382 RepID=UPI00210C357C|nr:DNA (cytosine-5-)-methyltransferase [Pedobacter sp. SYSU D00382]
MKFIDLFAGLGGFHQALSKLGHECVFASEKKEHLAQLYEINYGIKPNRNIRDITPEFIPDHDILCAGFPCQPFSKAGNMQGLEDIRNGSFFDILVEIIMHKRPRYFILENVRNIESHDDFKTWKYISEKLAELGYHIKKSVLSPHHFDIPQHRERLFIIGSLEQLDHFDWPQKMRLTHSVRDFLYPRDIKKVEPSRLEVISLWQEFLDIFPSEVKIPGFPIWSMEFGANYPTDIPISELSNEELEKYRGSFGIPLKGMSYIEKLANLPSYAVKNKKRKAYPEWKVRWILDNRNLYKNYKNDLQPLIPKLKSLPVKSWQKFEWNCGDSVRDIKQYILQFRASGLRVKKADFFPSLVTVSTQVPIIGWEDRYITPYEAMKIQSFDEIILPEGNGSCFSALGNAVNVQLVFMIAQNLLTQPDVGQYGAKVNLYAC